MEKRYTESTDSSGRDVTLDRLARPVRITSSFYHSAASRISAVAERVDERSREQHYCTPHSSHTQSNGVTTSD